MLKEQQTSVPDFPFFLNSNPGVLLRSFDIPEPVIHPPGIDPYSVLNPNPPSDNGLESLPALDIDPSAVSQTQPMSRTTDLTVSEHAGGTLIEPAIESTTSYSPANSGVVAQKTVNNVTITNIRSKDTHFIFCDVCNISCDTENVLKRHKEGKRHKNKVQKLAVSSATTQEPEKKQDLLQSEASVDSLFVWGVPDVGCINQNLSTDHVEGEKLAAQVTGKDGLPNPPTSVRLTTVTDKAQDKLNAHQTGWCEVCKVSCTSDKSLQKHILGKKHKKNLKNSEKIVAPSLTPIASMATIPTSNPPGSLKSTGGNLVDSEKLTVCPSTFIARTPPSSDLLEHANSTKGETVHSEELCKVSCSSNVRSIYESGKMHMKNLERSEKIPDLPLNPPIHSLATPGNVEISNSEENKSAMCELCGICCNSYDELNKHTSGKKHKKNVKKSEEMFGVGSEGSMEDERCKRKANWESDDEEEDPDRKKQKMMEEEKALISCKVCNVACNSLIAFTSHLASHDHSVMALKQVNVEAESNEVQLL